jgi:hypothetical protein
MNGIWSVSKKISRLKFKTRQQFWAVLFQFGGAIKASNLSVMVSAQRSVGKDMT